MSDEDKARYGRAVLLVLNTCPVGLRRVIEHYYATHSFTGFDAFLDEFSNKHQLFHLRFQKCCLVHCNNRNLATQRRTELWNLLYKEILTNNPHGDRGKCLCMYEAIPAVTTHVMDVTLCCLLLRNICPGVNITHIEDICTVRNQIIHATSVTLDEQSFNDAWNKVETALLSLSSMSTSVQLEIKNSLQETRFGDLSTLERLMAQEGRIGLLQKALEKNSQEKEVLETNTRRELGELGLETSRTCTKIDDINKRVTTIEENDAQIPQQIESLEINSSFTNQAIENLEFERCAVSQRVKTIETESEKISQRLQTVETDLVDTQEKMVYIERSIMDTPMSLDKRKERVLKALLTINKRATANIQMSPLQRSHEKIDIKNVYLTPRISKILMKDEKKFANEVEISIHGAIYCDDLFYKNGEPVRFIFMQGEAGHGKTMFCQLLVNDWCILQEEDEANKWNETCLLQLYEHDFDFVFMIMLKNVQKSRACLIDMICDDFSKEFGSLIEDIKYVIASDKCRCLVIVDGLDEWKISQEIREELTNEPIPNIGCTSSCTFLFTYRSWKHAEIEREILPCDRVIQVKGFHNLPLNDVIHNILVTLETNKEDRRHKLKDIEKISKMSKTLDATPFLKIPLIARQFVKLCLDGQIEGRSLTSFHLATIQLLIKVAIENKRLDAIVAKKYSNSHFGKLNLPPILKHSRNRIFQNFLPVLNKLGEIAYSGLLSRESLLVFGKEEFQEKLDGAELEFSYHVGLLSQNESPGSYDEENVEVYFLNKSIQKFLAAIHVVCSENVGIQSFCKQLFSVEIILELSDVIIFVSGLCPSLGGYISNHIDDVSSRNNNIQTWREDIVDSYFGFCSYSEELFNQIEQLFELQTKCYKEIQTSKEENTRLLENWTASRQNFSSKDLSLQPFHIANLLVGGRDRIPVQDMKDLMEDSNVEVTAVYVDTSYLQNYENGQYITDSLKKLLLRTKSMQYLLIESVCSSDAQLRISETNIALKSLKLRCIQLSEPFLRDQLNSIEISRQLKTLSLTETSLYTFCSKCLSKANQSEQPIIVYPCGKSTKLENNMSLVSLLNVLPDCNNLTSFEIDYWSIYNIPCVLLDIIPHLKHLQNVSFLSRSTWQFNGSIIEEILQLSHLQSLSFFGINLNEMLTEVISKISGLLRLKLMNINLDSSCLYHISKMSQLEMLRLENVTISDSDTPYTFRIPKTTNVFLVGIDFGEISIELMSGCDKTLDVKMYNVALSTKNWSEFVLSVMNQQHNFHVTLVCVNIDKESFRIINESPYLEKDTEYTLFCTRSKTINEPRSIRFRVNLHKQ